MMEVSYSRASLIPRVIVGVIDGVIDRVMVSRNNRTNTRLPV